MLFCFSCLFACFPSLEDEVLLCRPDWPRSPCQVSLKLTETHGSASKGLELKSCTTTSAPSFILENFKFLLHFMCCLVIYLFCGGVWTHTYHNTHETIRGWLVGVGSPTTLGVLGLELRSSGLATDDFVCWAISLAPSLVSGFHCVAPPPPSASHALSLQMCTAVSSYAC